MQLTHHTDFSLRVLVFLAVQKQDALVTISDIANDFNIAKNHLTKVVHKLSKHGYIVTVRGKNGGLCLAKAPAELNVGDIVKTMEANIEVVNCKNPVCPLSNACELKGILNEAQDAFFATLEKYTLADIVRQPDKIINLLNSG